MAEAQAGQTWHHPLAKSAFSASGSSGLYDRARPSYPDEAISLIASVMPSSAAVVELGSGTGIFTRCLLSPTSPTRSKLSSVLAVEPANGMRQGFANAVKHDAQADDAVVELDCVYGTFDKIPVADSSVDLLVAAQAYHWTGSDPKFHEVCIAEAARVLKPGGHFALIWNLEDREAARWVAQIRDAYEAHEADTPQYRRDLWRTIFDTPSFRSHFTLLPSPSSSSGDQPATSQNARPTLTVKRDLPTTLQGVKDRVLSKSYITALSPSEQDAICRKVDEIWARGEDLKWADKGKGDAWYPYATHLYLIRRN